MRPELMELDDRFVIEKETVRLGRDRFVIERPRSAEELISEADFERDERLPYWAEVWPSARVLAEFILEQPIQSDTHSAPLTSHSIQSDTDSTPPLRGIELGCGLGLVTIAAMRRGWEMTATDYYEDALRFTARNSLNTLWAEPTVRIVDWRSMPDDLGTFDLVLAADVLYERQYAELVADAVAGLTSRSGAAFIADQGRVALGSFLEELGRRGMSYAKVRVVAPEEGVTGVTVTLWRVWHGQ